MPIATAVWLIDNTSLTFDQIADFCKLHPLQVKGIADGDVAAGVRGIDPISNHQLTREELEKAEGDPAYHMKLAALPRRSSAGAQRPALYASLQAPEPPGCDRVDRAQSPGDHRRADLEAAWHDQVDNPVRP